MIQNSLHVNLAENLLNNERRLCKKEKIRPTFLDTRSSSVVDAKERPIIDNTNVVCQIAYALVDGDRILCQAQSTELDRYGLSAGLKNYAAAYCTGLLCARRLLQKLGLDELYEE